MKKIRLGFDKINKVRFRFRVLPEWWGGSRLRGLAKQTLDSRWERTRRPSLPDQLLCAPEKFKIEEII